VTTVAGGLQAAEMRLRMNCTCSKWKNEKERYQIQKERYQIKKSKQKILDIFKTDCK